MNPLQRRAAWLLILVAAAVNLPSLIPGFIHDDHAIVEKNDLVRDPSRLGAIFTKGYWNVSDVPVQNLYRPVTILSFALNHAAGGDHPFGHRLVNLALHLLVTLLLYAVARRVCDAAAPAARVMAESAESPARGARQVRRVRCSIRRS